MRSAAPAATAGSEFDQFLYAPIAEERSGMLLSVLSALARMNLDPWDEAARLARLPRAAATSYLTTLIAALPEGPVARTDPGALAERLIALLPRRLASKGPSPAAESVSGSSLNRRPLIGPLAVYLLLMLLLLVNQWLTERAAQAGASARAAASSQTSVALPRNPAPSSTPAPAPPRN
jgi:hypothetical protein